MRAKPRESRWRKATGVEPAWERLTPPTGFEARPRHRARLPSNGATLPRRRLQGLQPGAVLAQDVGVAHPAGQPGAVEEFEDLDRALAAQPGGVAECGCGDGAFARGKRGDQLGQLAHAVAVEEQVAHYLAGIALQGERAQQ